MHFAERVLIAVSLHIGPARSPACAQQHDRTGGNFPVAAFPGFDMRHVNQIVRVFGALALNVKHNGRAKELFHWNLVDRDRSRRKVNRRVKMRSIVLQHPEAAGKDAVLRSGCVVFRFKEAFVSGPRHELIVDRVSKVDHLRFVVVNVCEQAVWRSVLSEERHDDEEGSSDEPKANAESRPTAPHSAPPNRETAQRTESSAAPRVTRESRLKDYGSGMPGVATMPAMRRISWYTMSVIGEISSRTFFSSFIFFNAVFARSST